MVVLNGLAIKVRVWESDDEILEDSGVRRTKKTSDPEMEGHLDIKKFKKYLQTASDGRKTSTTPSPFFIHLRHLFFLRQRCLVITLVARIKMRAHLAITT